jgi:PTH1 family peptidyl-tRNA hydrolase
MIVVQDSLSHKIEKVFPKFGGFANGHKSIISALGGEMGFHRLRIGIGRDQTDAAAYVLRKLSSHERQFWGANGGGIELIVREIRNVARQNPVQ